MKTNQSIRPFLGSLPKTLGSLTFAAGSRASGSLQFKITGIFFGLGLLLTSCGEKDSASPEVSVNETTPAASEVPAETPEEESVPEEAAGKLDVEKDELKFGFIKLTDCAPIVIAKEKGFFEDEGLQVEVIAQSNWKLSLIHI